MDDTLAAVFDGMEVAHFDQQILHSHRFLPVRLTALHRVYMSRYRLDRSIEVCPGRDIPLDVVDIALHQVEVGSIFFVYGETTHL